MDIHHVGSVSYPEFAAALEDWNELEGDSHWQEWASIAFDSFAQSGTNRGVRTPIGGLPRGAGVGLHCLRQLRAV
eukprot:4342598-Pyramimonas_sp.AAC.1